MTTIEDVRLLRGLRKLAFGVVWKIMAQKAGTAELETTQDESGSGSIIYHLHEPALIEPVSGYVITERGLILENSLTPNNNNPEKRPFRIAVPSPHTFREALKTSATRTYSSSKVISTRHFWEWNYYHFYFDVLGPLGMMEGAGLAKHGTTLVAAKYLDETSFGRQAIQRPGFARYQWMAPDKEFVYSRETYFALCKTTYKERILYILDQLDLPTAQREKDVRLFLTRSGSRKIVNLEALIPILRQYNFQVVDTSGMSVFEQATLFTQVRHLIANHGAGTTNIIFRGEMPLSVLELHSHSYMNFDHKRICNEMGHQWDSLGGTALPGRAPNFADFEINADLLEEKIQRMLEFSK